jgi:hypothetical protein
VSTNCTVVYLVTAQSVGGAELADFRLDLVLKRLKPCELVHSPGQALKVLNDQRAHGGVTLRGGEPGIAVDIVGNGNRNVLHRFTVNRFCRRAEQRTSAQDDPREPVSGANVYRLGRTRGQPGRGWLVGAEDLVGGLGVERLVEPGG